MGKVLLHYLTYVHERVVCLGGVQGPLVRGESEISAVRRDGSVSRNVGVGVAFIAGAAACLVDASAALCCGFVAVEERRVESVPGERRRERGSAEESGILDILTSRHMLDDPCSRKQQLHPSIASTSATRSL